MCPAIGASVPRRGAEWSVMPSRVIWALSAASALALLSCGYVTGGPDGGERVMAICELQTGGDRLIGHQLTVRGTVRQDIEGAVLEDRGCPISLQLEPEEGAPSALECILSSGGDRCGGVSRSGQTITVVGILMAGPHAASASASGSGVTWTPARMKVQRMAVAVGGQ